MLQNHTFGQSIYPTDNNLLDCGGIYIRRMGELNSSGFFRYEKINMEYNIHFVFSGRGTLIIDGIKYTPEKGDIFMLCPRTHVSYFDSSDSPWQYCWGALGISDNHPALSALSLNRNYPVKKYSFDDPVWNIVRDGLANYRSGKYSPFYPSVLAVNILDRLATNEKIVVKPADRIKRIIDTSEIIPTVKEVSNKLEIDRTTVFRLFKQEYGISVKQYIDDSRYGRVCELLKSTAYPIRDISRLCGFDNPHYFSRAFRKRYGISPSQWRNRGN